MLRLAINHTTTYQYSSEADHCLQYLRIYAAAQSNQQVTQWEVYASEGSILTQVDGFGNTVGLLSVIEPYQHLSVVARGEVVLNTKQQAKLDDFCPAAVFLYQTAYTNPSAAMRQMADQYISHVTRSNLITLATALLDAMPYTTGSTTISTTAAEAFAQGQGVCQDHTHAFVGMVRYKGICARYVSGYLYMAVSGHFASHAWAEVLLDGLWYCFDVSNQLFTPSQHVQIAVGRDYLEVAPVRGIRQNGGLESMSAMVQIDNILSPY